MKLLQDIENLKGELARKEALLEKHTERLKRCQMILQQQGGTSGPPVQQSHPVPTCAQSNLQVPQSHSVPQQQPHLSQAGSLPHYSSHHIQQISSQTPGLPQYQGYSGSMHSQSISVPPPPPPAMQSHPGVPVGQRPQAPPSYPQGPLAYLEQTTSSIGLPDRR